MCAEAAPEGAEHTVLTYLQETAVAEANGVSSRTYLLAADQMEPAAAAIGSAIVRRRLGHNPELVALWEKARLSGVAPDEETRELLTVSLLTDLGTRQNPAPPEHLHGLIEESIWREIAATDLGRGNPIRVEGHGLVGHRSSPVILRICIPTLGFRLNDTRATFTRLRTFALWQQKFAR